MFAFFLTCWDIIWHMEVYFLSSIYLGFFLSSTFIHFLMTYFSETIFSHFRYLKIVLAQDLVNIPYNSVFVIMIYWLYMSVFYYFHPVSLYLLCLIFYWIPYMYMKVIFLQKGSTPLTDGQLELGDYHHPIRNWI